MATTHNNSNHSRTNPTTTNTTATRARSRKPPVAERMMVSAPLASSSASAVSSAAPPASPPPAASASPPITGAPGADPAPAPTVAFPVPPPPSVTIPAVPDGFVPVNAADLRGFHMLAAQIAAVPDSIAELQSLSNYGVLFGITAPDVGQLTQRLGVAAQWATLLSQTYAWYQYVKSQQGMSWKDTVLLLDGLKAPFDLATTANPAVLTQYPALARLLGARKAAAKRGVVTRAKKKAAKVAAAAGVSPTPSAAQTPTPPGAPSPATANGAAPAPTATTAARVVTVQG